MLELILDINDIIKKCIKHKWLIIGFFLSSFTVGILFLIFGTELWTSSATIKTFKTETFTVPNSETISLNLDYFQLDILNPERENLHSSKLVDSKRFAYKTMEKFDLVNYFEIEEEDSLKTRDLCLKKYYEDVLTASYDEESELVIIRAKTKDRQLSKDIVDFQIAELRNYYLNNFFNYKSELLDFLNARLTSIELKRSLLLTELKKDEYTKNSNFLQEKVTSKLELYYSLLQKKITNEIQIDIAKKMYGELNPATEELIVKNQAIDSKLKDLEEKRMGLISGFNDIPKNAIEHKKLEFELSIYDDLYGYVKKTIEATNIDKLREQKVLEIVDDSYLAGIRTSPDTKIVLSLCLIISLTLSFLSIVFIEDVLPRLEK